MYIHVLFPVTYMCLQSGRLKKSETKTKIGGYVKRKFEERMMSNGRYIGMTGDSN